MYAYVSVFFYSTLFLRLNHVVAWINGSFFYIVMHVFYSVKGPFKLFLVGAILTNGDRHILTQIISGNTQG